MRANQKHKIWICSLPAIAIAVTGLHAGWVQIDGGGGPWGAPAWAEEGHTGGGGRGGGATDHHASGHEDSHDDGMSTRPGGHGRRESRAGAHGSARGAGKAVEDRILRGQRPVWAQEGIPEVELGRLNVSRSPTRVLDRAEAEALATYTTEMRALYELDADAAAEQLRSDFTNVARYDSPLQNLALYRDLMVFGQSQLPQLDTDLKPASEIDLAAIFLGSAADKNIPINEDTVVALNRILGLVEMAPEDRITLATKAETVREAILSGHGPTEEHE